jgi:two-component system, NarL family, nitrate/nitrite response regulator NarL
MAKPSKNDAIRVAIIDDHPLMRKGIVQALCSEPDLDIVGEGGSADDAVALAERLLPDVMLIDINMEGGGLNALKRIANSCPAVACIVITVREDEETVSQALRVGARGYMLKGIGGSELAATIRAINQGEVYITPSLAARLLMIGTTKHDAVNSSQARFDVLTAREDEILRLIAKGMINKEIGTVLDISEKTVKHYVTNILQKLQVRNRVEAALLARQNS